MTDIFRSAVLAENVGAYVLDIHMTVCRDRETERGGVRQSPNELGTARCQIQLFDTRRERGANGEQVQGVGRRVEGEIRRLFTRQQTRDGQ